jgi:cysteine desulfurase / selenocysteine lyase
LHGASALPARDGRLPAENVIAAILERTRIVRLCEVSFSPVSGPISPRSARSPGRDIFFLVDGAQSSCVVHTDVEAAAIDGLAVSTQKRLLGTYGMGFLCCRQSWAERINPVYRARFGVDLGATHEAARGGDDFPLMPDARRFDLGNYDFAAAAGVDVSLAMLDRIGNRNIEAPCDAACPAPCQRPRPAGLSGGGRRLRRRTGRHHLDWPARRRRSRQQR